MQLGEFLIASENLTETMLLIFFCLFVFCFGLSNVEFGERGTWPLMSPAYGRRVFTVRTERGEVSL